MRRTKASVSGRGRSSAVAERHRTPRASAGRMVFWNTQTSSAGMAHFAAQDFSTVADARRMAGGRARAPHLFAAAKFASGAFENIAEWQSALAARSVEDASQRAAPHTRGHSGASSKPKSIRIETPAAPQFRFSPLFAFAIGRKNPHYPRPAASSTRANIW